MFKINVLYGDRGGSINGVQFDANSTLEVLYEYSTSSIKDDDGVMFVPNRISYQARTGKIHNLYKTTRDYQKEIWSLSPEIPEVPASAYDYFTWIDVYDEARGLIVAYTGSGYKVVIDAKTGKVQQIEKDRVVHYLEYKGSQIILDDQSVIDLGDKKVRDAILIDQEIVVHIDPKSYEDVVKKERRWSVERKAKEAGLPIPEAPPEFVGAVDNLWKLSLDGKILKTLAPKVYPFPFVNFFSSLAVSLKPLRIYVCHSQGGWEYVSSRIDLENFTLASFKEIHSRS